MYTKHEQQPEAASPYKLGDIIPHLAKVGEQGGQNVSSFRQSKRWKFMHKMHKNTFGSWALPRPTRVTNALS